MTAALWVSLGAGLGAAARWHLSVLLARRASAPVVATTVVNVLGSLILGLLVGLGADGTINLAIGIGFCGAFTTWSTLSHNILESAAEQDIRRAALHLTLGVLSGIAAAGAGFVAGSLL